MSTLINLVYTVLADYQLFYLLLYMIYTEATACTVLCNIKGNGYNTIQEKGTVHESLQFNREVQVKQVITAQG